MSVFHVQSFAGTKKIQYNHTTIALQLVTGLTEQQIEKSFRFKATAYHSASMYATVLTSLNDKWQKSHQGSSSGSQPSSSSRQKKQQAISGSLSLGQWTKPALAICKRIQSQLILLWPEMRKAMKITSLRLTTKYSYSSSPNWLS